MNPERLLRGPVLSYVSSYGEFALRRTLAMAMVLETPFG
jgi:hypothetical protein